MPTQSTTYYATVTDGVTSCRDSVRVDVQTFNPILFTQDTLKICGTSQVLDAGSGYGSYSWSTGESTQAISVTTTGWYTCTVSNDACTKTDSVYVAINNFQIVNNDTSICSGNSLTIHTTGTAGTGTANARPIPGLYGPYYYGSSVYYISTYGTIYYSSFTLLFFQTASAGRTGFVSLIENVEPELIKFKTHRNAM